MNNYKTLKRYIDNMCSGECISINSINLSIKGIETVRNNIKNGIISPVESELKKSIAPEYIEKYMKGEYILPQMRYIKL